MPVFSTGVGPQTDPNGVSPFSPPPALGPQTAPNGVSPGNGVLPPYANPVPGPQALPNGVSSANGVPPPSPNPVPQPNVITGTGGDDTFLIDRHNFNATIVIAATVGASFQNDIIRFGDGISPADLHYARVGTDL